MSNHAEAIVGAPSAAPPAAPAGGRGGGGRGGAPPAPPAVSWYTGEICAGRNVQPPAAGRSPSPLTPETQSWRTSAETMNKYRDLRKQFDDAGIDLGVLCYNMNASVSDDEIDYAFRMAQALGVKAISSSSTVTVAKRVASFADKYKLTWAGHGHDDVCDPEQFAKPETFEKIMSFSPYIGVNLDIGHFTAAGYDAVTFIRRYHDRITNLHLKDRTRNPISGRGGNVRWGDGETPIRRGPSALEARTVSHSREYRVRVSGHRSGHRGSKMFAVRERYPGRASSTTALADFGYRGATCGAGGARRRWWRSGPATPARRSGCRQQSGKRAL